jgi:DnaJ family protein C protein 7
MSDASDDDKDDVSMQSSDNEDGDSSEEEEEDYMITQAEHKANGNAAYQQKDYRTAIGHYTSAIDLAKKELALLREDFLVPGELASQLASYYGNRAAAFTMILKYQEALDDCDHAIQVDQKFIKAHFRKAKVLTTLGRLDEALKAYSYGLIHDPNHATAIKERGEVQTIQQRFQLANDVLLKTDNHPKKHARQALAQIQIVLAACPLWKDATLTKIDALSRLHRIDEAYSLSTNLMRQDGYETNNDLIFIRARCLFYQGVLDQAMKHLRIILSSDPDNKKAFQMVKMVRALKKCKEEADQAYKSRNYADAVKLYGDAIDACPAENTSYTAKLYFNRAVSHNGLRNHAECVADCTKCIGLDDEYAKAYLRRAASNLLIGGKGECTQAISDYEEADRLAKTDDEKKDIRKKVQNAKVQLKRAGQKDLYKIMDVTRDATESEIKKAYRKMALKHHVSCVIVVLCRVVCSIRFCGTIGDILTHLTVVVQ